MYPYLVTPVTDDSPFFWHFARFRDALRSARSRGVRLDAEDSTGERVLVLLLAFVVLFAAACLLLPFAVVGGEWRAMPFKARAGLYFAAIGVGFMFFEVSLIQILTLFLDYPSYSLSVTLFGLLVSSGVGSMLSARHRRRGTGAPLGLVACVGALVLFYRFGWPGLVDHMIGAALPLRVAVALALIAPLGLCLGAFMPLGLRAVAEVGEQRAQFVAWAWAVNGFCSVISSILAAILAMTIGFTMILVSAVVAYLVAVLTLPGLTSPARRPG